MKAVGFVARGLVVAALIGCSGAPEDSPSGGSTSPSASAAATAAPPSSPGPTVAQSASTGQPATEQPAPSPSPTDQPPSPSAQAGPKWELLAETESELVASNVVGFDAGYVGYGLVGLEISFSEDGVSWEQISLPPSEPRCEDEDQENFISRAATDGRSAILLAEYTTADDCELQTYAWLTNDGHNWRRSGPIGEPRGFTEAEPVDVWTVPGGWEVAISSYDPTDPASDATAIWQSPYGTSWTQTATVAGHGNVDGAADAGGNRLLSVTGHVTTAFGPPASQERLVTSIDGVTWTDVTAQFTRTGDVAVVSAIEPPTSNRSTWLLFVDEYDEQVSSDDSFSGGTLWLSADLSRWEPLSPPKVRTFPQAATSEGLIATACDRLWTDCAMYLTRDAREWTRINSDPRPDLEQWVAEGPAGVLVATDERTVYRLRP